MNELFKAPAAREEDDLRGPAVVSRGSVATGFTLTGPFDTIAAAIGWWKTQTESLLGESVTIMLLKRPKE